MKTAAIYARYSTDLQSDRSIEDQVALCRAYAEREGLTVTATYEDRARSGGSLFGRDGVNALMRDAAGRRFDVVIVEALDRLSRDMADMAGIFKRLTFDGVRILSVTSGQADEMAVALRGLLGQLFLKDVKDKVRRGLAGRARDGLIAGGLAYGYAVVPGRPGERTIVAEEAEIVRRIFKEFVLGHCARSIAKRLNADGIRPPQGRAWCASTLNGGPHRGGGMLRNSAYAGQLSWNRCPETRDPQTNRRVVRPTAPSERITAEAPHLAIVDADLWAATCARFEAMKLTVPAGQRKKKFLLTGLLRCIACGAGMSVCGKDKYGRPRMRCSRHRESGDCPAARTYYLDVIERTVLTALKRELCSPAAIAEFLRAYREARHRLAAGAGQRRRVIDRRLADIARELDRVTDYLVRGIGDEERLDARSKELAAEDRALRIEAARMPARVESIGVHPTLIDRYRAEIETLEQGLAERLATADSPAALAVREMITSVTPFRDAAGRLMVEIVGSIAATMEQTANKVGGLVVGPVAHGQYAYSELRIPFTLRECA